MNFPARSLAAPAVCVLMLMEGVSQVHGQSSVSIKPVADTTLFERFPGNNLGGQPELVSGTIAQSLQRSRALMSFDVAGMIPPGSIINSASLTMTVTRIPSPSVSSTYDLRRVLVGWGEGVKPGQTGSAATSGEASWNSRLTGISGWSTVGGGIGTDFVSSVSASLVIGTFGAYTFNSTAGLVADLQLWLDNPSTNFGWALFSQSEGTLRTAHRFGSSEHPTASSQPTLTIQYTVIPEPGTIGLLLLGGVCIGWAQRRRLRKL